MLITNKHYRQNLKNKKRIVIKVGSSSLVHPETGETDLLKLEQLVRVLCDLRNQGKDVVLVSSGAIGVGRKALGLNERPKELAQKQACASVGQGMLMMIYQKSQLVIDLFRIMVRKQKFLLFRLEVLMVLSKNGQATLM